MKLLSLTGITTVVMWALAASACGSAAPAGNDGPAQYSTGFERNALNEEDLAKYTTLALDGDAEAAEKVELHYDNYMKSDMKAQAVAVGWLRIAAENGQPTAQLKLAIMLDASDEPADKQRARFWYRRAGASGDPHIVGYVKSTDPSLLSPP